MEKLKLCPSDLNLCIRMLVSVNAYLSDAVVTISKSKVTKSKTVHSSLSKERKVNT